MLLTNYNDCKFTAFISYSSADSNEYDGGWAKNFDIELKKKLSGKLARLKGGTKVNYIFESEPVPSGDLEKELENKISDSFVMIILVGENYLSSNVCLKECRYFVKNIEANNYQKRLFVIALTKPAMSKLEDDWGSVLGIKYTPAFIPFFSENEKNEPISKYLTLEDGNPVRNKDYDTKISVLAKGIVSVVKESVESGLSGESEKGESKNESKVLIGVVAGTLSNLAQELKEYLAVNGFHVSFFTRDDLENLPDDELSREYNKNYDYLILLYDRNKPIMRLLGAGGHLKYQQDAWLKSNEKKSLLWFKCEHTGDANNLASNKDLDFINQIDSSNTPCMTKEGLLGELTQLTNRTSSDEKKNIFRFYIEKNHNEDMEWRILGERIKILWREINPGNIPRLDVKTFDIDQINSDDFKKEIKNVDGIVTLWGKKEKNAIKEQLIKLNQLFLEVDFPSNSNSISPPCFVAFLSPPNKPQNIIQSEGWDLYKFNKNNRNGFELEADENEKLKDLLKFFIDNHRSS